MPQKDKAGGIIGIQIDSLIKLIDCYTANKNTNTIQPRFEPNIFHY